MKLALGIATTQQRNEPGDRHRHILSQSPTTGDKSRPSRPVGGFLGRFRPPLLSALLVLLLALSGCATKFYDSNGKPRFSTTANVEMKNARLGDFSADELKIDSTSPINAVGKTFQGIMSTLGVLSVVGGMSLPRLQTWEEWLR
jgi:hypothetical protein